MLFLATSTKSLSHIRVHPCHLLPSNNNSTCKPDDQVPSKKTDQRTRTNFERDSNDDGETPMHNNASLILENPEYQPLPTDFKHKTEINQKIKYSIAEPIVIQSGDRADVAVKNNAEKLKIKQHVEIRVNDGAEWESVKILNRGGKSTGKYSNSQTVTM